MNSQSIILNLNKDYAKGQAHNYLTPVSQAFEIGDNAEVAMYGANIKRKPISLTKDENVKTQTCEIGMGAVMFPINSQILGNTLCHTSNVPVFINNLYTEEQPLLNLTIESDDYSRDEFCNRVTIEANSFITQVLDNKEVNADGSVPITVSGKKLHLEVPYQYLYDKQDFFLGMCGIPRKQDLGSGSEYAPGVVNPCQIFNVDNTEASSSTGALLLNYVTDNTDNEGIMSITANAAISVADYTGFGQIHSSPVFPLLQGNENNNLFKGTQSFFEWDIDINDTAADYEKDFVVGFTNTHLQSSWAATDTPELLPLVPDNNNVPNYLFVGARFFEKVATSVVEESYVELFIPPQISDEIQYLNKSEDLKDLWGGAYMRLAKVGLEDVAEDHTGLGGKYGFRFLACENQANVANNIKAQGTIYTEKNIYGRVYGFQFYSRVQGDQTKILYDSREHNIYIPGNLIEDGFLFNSAESKRTPAQRTNLGFQPYIFINKLDANEGISNPNGNFVAYNERIGNKVVYRAGFENYDYKIQNEVLRDIMGVNIEGTSNISVLSNQPAPIPFRFNQATETQFNPNAYPLYPKTGGLTQLFTDNNTYNIEINLPVDCFATTKGGNNNIGQKRTIIYKTEPFIEGNISDIDQTFIFKNIVPNNLKFLTLDNRAPLNLNNMNIQIRRSDNNELATELEDASVELLIKSNKK